MIFRPKFVRMAIRLYSGVLGSNVPGTSKKGTCLESHVLFESYIFQSAGGRHIVRCERVCCEIFSDVPRMPSEFLIGDWRLGRYDSKHVPIRATTGWRAHKVGLLLVKRSATNISKGSLHSRRSRMHPRNGIHLRKVLFRYPSSPLTRKRGVFFIFPVVLTEAIWGSSRAESVIMR